MKITEKMYLLAKDVVEEYENNQRATNESLNFIPQTENRFEVEVKAGGVNVDFELNENDLCISDELIGESKWFDEATEIPKEQIDEMKSRSDADFRKLYFGDFINESFLTKSPNDIEVIDPIQVKPKRKAKVKTHEDYSQEVKTCYLDCVDHFPEDLRPNEKEIVSWLDTIEKLNRIDSIEFDDISLLVQAVRKDSFWSKNFLSLTKLRKKNKDKVVYWKVFREKFKIEKSKTQSMMEMHEQAKRDLGL